MNYLTNYYKNLSEQLQEKYNNLLNEIAGEQSGENMTAWWGSGLGGALGQGSPANQFMDYIENNSAPYTSSTAFYQNLRLVDNPTFGYGGNANLASNLQNFPPQGSNGTNMPKGWYPAPNLPAGNWISPGGWLWLYSNGMWSLRPNPYNDSGNSNSIQPPTPTVPMGNRTQTLRAFSPVKRRK
jgi:hypothetical protein